MSEPLKNPFDLLLEQFRAIVREEIAIALSGSTHAGSSPETADEEKAHQRAKVFAQAKAAADAGALLTAGQLAVMLQLNKATIYVRVKKKTIPYVKSGRFVRFDLREVLESQRNRVKNPS